MRLALFVSKKHRRSRGFGWRALVALFRDALVGHVRVTLGGHDG
jgi:hypothetical protein